MESEGIEPSSMACDASVVPLDYDPVTQWTDRESNPDLRTASAPSSRWTIGPSYTTWDLNPGRSGRVSDPRQPAALGGIEPLLDAVDSGASPPGEIRAKK